MPTAAVRRLGLGDRIAPPTQERTMTLVDSGALAVQLDRESGGSVVLEVLGRGMCVSSALEQPDFARESLSVMALVPSRIVQVSQEAVERRCLSDDRLAPSLLRVAARHKERERDHLVSLLDRNPLRRTAFAVWYLAAAFQDTCPVRTGARIPLSQNFVAATANLARQTANRALRVLARAQVLALEPRLVCVLDADALSRIARGRETPIARGSPRRCELLNPGCAASCVGKNGASH